jgi:hypothetical protein
MATMAESWAMRDEPVSFNDFELALCELVFAFARWLAIMLFLARREEHVMRSYPADVRLHAAAQIGADSNWGHGYHVVPTSAVQAPCLAATWLPRTTKNTNGRRDEPEHRRRVSRGCHCRFADWLWFRELHA